MWILDDQDLREIEPLCESKLKPKAWCLPNRDEWVNLGATLWAPRSTSAFCDQFSSYGITVEKGTKYSCNTPQNGLDSSALGV